MVINNVDLEDALGNPARIAGPDQEPVILTLFQAARTVIWNMPTAGLTIGDSEMARGVLRDLGKAEQNGNKWEAEADARAWTLEQLKAHAPAVFGINAICVVEAFDQ